MLCPAFLWAQDETPEEKLVFTGDFRFRVEHDWNSMRPDGSFRADRSRLRYRLRFGFKYQLSPEASFGARVRTGRLDDQQGPHLTLGGNSGEFSIIEVGFEKAYFKWKKDWFEGWVGKNDFHFHKINELFWNDNVFPEGIALTFKLPCFSKQLTDLQIRAGHFIVNSQGTGFENDRYFQGLQLHGRLWGKRVTLFPGFYYFNQMANIPDGQGSYNIDYSILHLGAQVQLLKKPKLTLGLEYYRNLQDLSQNDSISTNRASQVQGEVLTLRLGELKTKGQWQATLYLARIEQFAIVDYFAQNDWARWDYSSFGAAGSRLSNFQGFEFRLGHAFAKNANLILRVYSVEELFTKTVMRKETGDRARIDLNVKL